MDRRQQMRALLRWHGANLQIEAGPDGQLIGAPDDWNIELQKIPFGVNKRLNTKSDRFAGYIDNRVYKLYTDAGYKHLYRVTLPTLV